MPVDNETRYPTPSAIRAIDVAAKVGLVLMLFSAVLYPELGNLEGKGAIARAIGYPAAAFLLPAVWYLFWRQRASFPWLADLLITITCFTDILGNRMDLYDTVSWFDDWMHFMNTGLLAAAFILLTLPRTDALAPVIERALAFGATAALAWELAEYYAFISGTSEVSRAYEDTLSDMTLGVMGSLVAAVGIHVLWRHHRLADTAPQLDSVEPRLPNRAP